MQLFNFLNKCRAASTPSELSERACLDRRRLEEAHMKYCILRMYQRYPAYFPKWTVSTLTDTLEDVTPKFYEAFSACFAGMK